MREACDLRVVSRTNYHGWTSYLRSFQSAAPSNASYVITFGVSCVIDHPRECSNQTWARNYGCYYYYTFFIMWQQSYTAKKLYWGELVTIGMLSSLETARAKKNARAAGWDEETYQRHIAQEGNNTWNAHPDGCFYCGSGEHHGQDCEDKELYWQSS